MPAASVILLKESSDGFDILMARRHIKSDFAPDVYVFPGGKADPEDAEEGSHLELRAVPRLTGRDEPEAGWRALHMAAIRELFEECGLLLGQFVDGSWVTESSPQLSRPLAEYRAMIRSQELTLRELAGREGITFAADHLRLFSNWITPEVLTRRFDTFFFLSRFPEGGIVSLADEIELTDSLWITPAGALERYRSGDFPLVFATERHLELLSRFDSVAQLWDAATAAVIEPVSPRWVMGDDGERTFLIPGDEGYESARIR